MTDCNSCIERDERSRYAESVHTILKDKVLHSTDAITSYVNVIRAIKDDFGIPQDSMLPFGQEPPHGFAEAKAKYMWMLNVRRNYVQYLRGVLKKRGQPAVGIPIFIEDADQWTEETTTFRLKHASIGSERFKRDYYFDKDKHRGTEIVNLHAHTKTGYQFWIVKWDTSNDTLTLDVSTWIIHHDDKQKRNTLYFARGYTFQEVPEFQEGVDAPKPVVYHPALMSGTSDITRRMAFRETVRLIEASSPVDDGWVTVAAPYSMSESLNNLRYMLEQFDLDGIIRTMNDKYFKEQWYRKLAEMFWYDADVYLRSPDRISELGLLRHDWFKPITTHPRDKEECDKHWAGFIKVRDSYNEWSNRFWKALNGRDVDLSEEVDFPSYPLHEPSPDDK